MSIWSQASEIALATPPERNRYADFLRAVSILMVILGHWLMTTAHYDASTGAITPILALDVVPWSAWLTWGFQVMPIFFIVGGFSNGMSLASAQKRQLSYPQWLAGRLQRLLTPLTLLVVCWALLAFALKVLGIQAEYIKQLSQAALVPTWFLAIYTMIVLLAPLSYRLWQRWGYWSLLAYILLAVLVDTLFFVEGFQWLGWTNYFWVWLAMHHLGFAWLDRRLGNPGNLLLIGLVSLAVLAALIFFGPYPVAMAGSPGEVVSNTLPPKVTLIALGLFQFGLLLAFEKPMNQLLQKHRVWTSTVIVNTMIMTVYLWHMTVLIGLMALAYFLGGFGLTMLTGSPEWWATRPLWIAASALVLLPLALALSPLERIASGKSGDSLTALRLIAGAMMAGLGIALASLWGFNGQPMSFGNTGIILLMLGGAWVCGVTLRQQASRSG
ncbi:MAG: acyltransferase [Pseudomonadota bacterium]